MGARRYSTEQIIVKLREADIEMGGRREGVEIVTLALKELLLLIPCVLIASAIPARNRCGPIFYSFLIPILLITLAVTAHMQD